MAPRLDDEHRRLELAVADLLDNRLLRSLGFAHRGGYERMWLGQAIHSRYQEQALARDGSYRREVTIRHSWMHRGWQVTLHGRIDGLRKRADDISVIEEIKSVRHGAQLSPATLELYSQQAGLYAWMLSKQTAAPVAAELVLIEIGSDAIHREPVEVDLRRLEAVVMRRLNRLLRGATAARHKRAARARAGRKLAFPYQQVRPGQERIIEAVEVALEHGQHVLAEAATGLGKTVAALYPAARYALEHDKRIFVLTAKTLQQEMAMTVLDLLGGDQGLRALRLRAKAKMCANDQVLCHEEYCLYAKDYYAKVEQTGIVRHLESSRSMLLPDDIFAVAKDAAVCPFEVSLELSGRLQAVVCDYNYAFDPYVALSEFRTDADLGNTILVIDELHNLVDRGRRYYSPMLSARAAHAAACEAQLASAPIHGEIARLTRRLATMIEEVTDDAAPASSHDAAHDSTWAAEQSFPEDRLWHLRSAFDQAFVAYLEHRRETKTLRADDRFVDLYFDLLKFLNALVLEGGAFSHFVERDAGDARWRILCKDASPFLGSVINRCHAVIGLSATLSPHAFYRDLLGFDPERSASLSLPSPFPRANRQVVIDPAIATTYRQRPENYPRIAERLGRFADTVPGNVLALFPSYHFLAQVAGLLRIDTKRILVQARSDTDREREAILETLRSALLRDVLLLGVAGGVFAEGVDYPGEMLKAVAVVGPCLPAPTLDQRLLRAYFDERFERGFEYAFIVPGMTRVIQAAGRLIRRAEDQGVIALFDQRFLQPAYRRHLPADWSRRDDLRDLAGEPAAVARQFFHPVAEREEH